MSNRAAQDVLEVASARGASAPTRVSRVAAHAAPTRALALAFALAVLAFLSLCTPVRAQPAPNEVLTVAVGSQRLLRQDQPVHRVAVGDPKIADVTVISPRELLLEGKALGTTSLIVWPRGKNAAPAQYRVEVGSGLAGTQADLLAHRDAVLASGTGAKGPVGDRSQVALESTQVLSQVKIVEVSRTALQQYGINFLHNGRHFESLTNRGTASGLSGIPNPGAGTGSSLSGIEGAALGSATGFLPIQDAFNFIFANDGYLGVLSVLENQGLARVLAEPSLTAMSGQTASFLAGGEFPVPVPQGGSGINGASTITIQFKQFGVRLSLTPTVLSKDRIALKVAPEVSELNFSEGITLNGFTVPGLDVRRTDTTVELGDGESFVISGLVSNNLRNNIDKVPWLGDLPVIGAFFRDTSINRQEKELIMVVTPHLVQPLARGATLPPLPGAQTDQYQPGFAHTMFMETGDFGMSDHGYSR
ncbi:MAG: type II and III secretion system protein family protein [Nevskia sp.]|nr:type II and III secretion system protein family protein [Nevskia sp.]